MSGFFSSCLAVPFHRPSVTLDSVSEVSMNQLTVHLGSFLALPFGCTRVHSISMFENLSSLEVLVAPLGTFHLATNAPPSRVIVTPVTFLVGFLSMSSAMGYPSVLSSTWSLLATPRANASASSEAS